MKFEQDFLESYSDESLICELKRVADLCQSGVITKAFFDTKSRCSSSMIQRRFGTWKEALNRAGLGDLYKGPPKCPLDSNSEQVILNEIRRVSQLQPEGVLKQSFFDDHGKCLSSYVVQRFGSWRNALQRAGLDEKYGGTLRLMPKGDKQEYFVKLLREVANKNAKDSVSISEFDSAQTGVSSIAVRRCFGSWSDALSVAGLNAKQTWQNPVSKEELFTNLAALWKCLRRQPTYSDLMPPYFGAKPYERIFGNFSKALIEFIKTPEGQECLRSFPEERRDTYTRALTSSDLLAELTRVADIMGCRVVTQADILKYSTVDPRTFARRFGSWEDAVGKAGLEIADSAKRFTKDDLYANLMATWETLGHRPSCDDMSLSVSKISAGTYSNRFGSWRKAILAFLQWVEQDQPDIDTPSVSSVADEAVSTESTSLPLDSAPLTLPDGKRDTKRVANPKQRFRVMKRDGYRCCICGSSQNNGIELRIDHKHAWAKGGRTIDENLWTLCNMCNAGKGADDL